MKRLIRSLYLLIFISSAAYAYNTGWRPSTYFEKIENARIIIIGSVHSITTTSVLDSVSVDEKFDIVKIEGNIIDSDGKRPQNDVVALRAPNGTFSRYRAGRYVFLLTGKDLSFETYDDPFPWLFSPSMSVEGNKLYVGNRLLVGIGDNGSLDLVKMNTCDISDFPVESETQIRMDWGRAIPEYSREEILRVVDRFECPDGSHWDREGRSVEQSLDLGMNLEEFEDKLVQHLKSKNIAATSDEQINRDVKRGSASTSNNVEQTKHLDAVLVPLLESQAEMRNRFNFQNLEVIFRRVERRRIRYESGQSNELIGLFDWDEYPNVKALLKKHELID